MLGRLVSCVVPLLLAACVSSPRLYEAALSGYDEEVRALLDKGESPNQRVSGGWTPLMIASGKGYLKTVNVLLKAGADPNARNSIGRTALMLASRDGYEKVVSALLASGADVDPVDAEFGQSALMLAAGRGQAAVVSLLLRDGASPRLRDRAGNTAIDLARAAGKPDIVRTIEDASAQP